MFANTENRCLIFTRWILRNLTKPVVFLFGAGATRGAFTDSIIPPPTDTDFFDVANQITGKGSRGTPLLAGKILREVYKLYGKTAGIRLESAYRDIETRASVGQMVRTNNQPKQWGTVKDIFTELIRRVYIHTICEGEPLKSKTSRIHQDILTLVQPGDTIVTFNYDLLIEESFQTANLWNPITGYGVKFGGVKFKGHKGWAQRWLESRGYNGESRSNVKLLKLHGSINWQRSGKKLNFNPYSAQGANNEREPRYQPISILAPGWKKDIEKKPYCDFWEIAGRELSQCKTLVILGYSLPETDLIAKSLFAEIVRNRSVKTAKKKLMHLHIADPSVTVREKFVDMFSEVLDANGCVYQYNGIEEFRNRMVLSDSPVSQLQEKLSSLEERVSALESKFKESKGSSKISSRKRRKKN